MICPTCGEAVPEGGRFCSACGHQLGGRDGDQRRVVTVVFADLVGFTSISESSDPEQVKRLVDDCFEELVAVVEAFGGRVDKIIGDAILALFGAPVGHEDDAERAVRAALRMQETLISREVAERLRLRVGVNTGEVLVGALRSGGDYTAMGDVVNTAQRLQSVAQPGQVLVGSATRAAAGDRISYKALGPQQVKGREEPVDAWVVLDTLEPPGRRAPRVAGPLVGRHSEMAVLTGEIDLAVRRRRAQLILLVGDAGVGKSRLAGELVDYARDRYDAWVLEGHCVPYGEANVWWPVAEALRQAADLDTDATQAEARGAVTELATLLFGSSSDEGEVTRITEGVLELLGYESGLRDIDPGRAREETMRALIDLTDAAAADRPVVVVLSGLHWADRVVLDTIDQLTARVGRNPYVIIGTARHGIHDRWAPPPGRHNSTVLHVEPLERDASEALLTMFLGDQIDRAVRDDLIDRSGGNPFFLEELVALLDETGSTGEVPVGADSPSDVAELSGLPDSLRGLIMARLDALDDPARAVVEDASVLGRSGPLEALQIMAAYYRSAEGIEGIVDELVDKDVLQLDGHWWSFRSDLMRDVAYGTMTKARRAASHSGIAIWMEENLSGPDAPDGAIDRMAHHYGTAAHLVADMGPVDGVPDDVRGRALRRIGEASARALESEHHRVGAELFSRALELLDDEPSAERWEALLGRSRCRVNLRDLDGAREDAEIVLAEARVGAEPVMVGRALTALGDAQQKAGHDAVARQSLTEAIDTLDRAGADRERGEALRLRGMAELFADEYEAAERSISDALEVARAAGDRRGEAWALQNLAWLAFETGRAHAAEQWIDRSVAAFTEIGDSGGLGWALGLAAWVKLHVGERDEAASLAASLLPETRARGDRWAEAMLQMLLASAHLWSGRAGAALEPAQLAESLFQRLGDDGGLVQSQATRGRALLLLGRLDEGWSVLSGTLSDSTADWRVAAADRTRVIGLTLGAVALGDPRGAEEIVDLDADPEIDIEAIGGIDLLAGLALVNLQLGDVGQAESLVDQFVADDDVPSPALAAAAALVRVASGRREEAVRLARSVPGSTKSTFLDRFMAAMALGLQAARDGDASGCTENLVAARAELEGTDDRLDLAVLALAETEAAAAMGLDDAARRAAAEDHWRALGVDPTGWRTAMAACLTAQPV